MRALSLPFVAVTFALANGCVEIPKDVRATFADSEPHENDYVRTRSDAPSPRGFLSDAEIARARDAGWMNERGAIDASASATSIDAAAPLDVDAGDGGS